MNIDQLDTLLKESPSPAMSLNPDAVLTGGKARRQRRRAAIGGGVLAGVILLSAAAAGGAAWRADNTLQPAATWVTNSAAASSPAAAKNHFFDVREGLKPGQFTSGAMAFGNSTPTPATIYQLSLATNGSVQIARVSQTNAGDVVVNLPTIGSLPGGVVYTRDRTQTVAVAPVPANATNACASFATAGASCAGIALGDKHFAAAVASNTESPKYFTWQTSDGQFAASTGEVATTAPLGGNTVYIFPTLKLWGIDGPDTGFSTQISGQSKLGFLGHGKIKSSLVYTGIALLPAGATDVAFTLKAGATFTPPAPHVVTVGASGWDAVMVTDISESQYKQFTGLRWTDALGTVHTAPVG